MNRKGLNANSMRKEYICLIYITIFRERQNSVNHKSKWNKPPESMPSLWSSWFVVTEYGATFTDEAEDMLFFTDKSSFSCERLKFSYQFFQQNSKFYSWTSHTKGHYILKFLLSTYYSNHIKHLKGP